jgi:drug/metabolite transporter (DMT)-like permease
MDDLSTSPEPDPSPAEGDWTVQATDTVVDLVGQVRDKTTGPLLTAARGVVYGIVVVILAVAVVVLLSIALLRFTDGYLPGGVWAAYFVVGAVFTIVGFVLWSQRAPAVDD